MRNVTTAAPPATHTTAPSPRGRGWSVAEKKVCEFLFESDYYTTKRVSSTTIEDSARAAPSRSRLRPIVRLVRRLDNKCKLPTAVPTLRTMSSAATPHAPMSAVASVPAGSATPAPPPPPPPANPGLPPPSTFDFLPELHSVLSRLMPAAARQASTTAPGNASADAPLEIEKVADAASGVFQKVRAAREAVMALPDIDRTCEDQQDEIDYLEARIARLKAALQQLGQPPREADDGDHTMTG